MYDARSESDTGQPKIIIAGTVTFGDHALSRCRHTDVIPKCYNLAMNRDQDHA